MLYDLPHTDTYAANRGTYLIEQNFISLVFCFAISYFNTISTTFLSQILYFYLLLLIIFNFSCSLLFMGWWGTEPGES